MSEGVPIAFDCSLFMLLFSGALICRTRKWRTTNNGWRM